MEPKHFIFEDEKVSMTVRLPADLVWAIDILCKTQGRTRTDVIRDAVDVFAYEGLPKLNTKGLTEHDARFLKYARKANKNPDEFAEIAAAKRREEELEEVELIKMASPRKLTGEYGMAEDHPSRVMPAEKLAQHISDIQLGRMPPEELFRVYKELTSINMTRKPGRVPKQEAAYWSLVSTATTLSRGALEEITKSLKLPKR